MFKYTGLFLFLATLLVYGLSYHGEGSNWNYFVLLADAFLHGRLYILQNPPWLNELVKFSGHYFVVYPPMPAILLTPFVAIFGTGFPQPFLSILLGATNVALSFLVLSKIFKKEIALWGSILFGFGTMHWYHAEVGSAWYIAHIAALFFLWLALLEVFTKKRLLIVGFLIGCAYLARLPVILAVVFVLLYLREKFSLRRVRLLETAYNFSLLFFGLLPALIFNALYNYFRFGVFSDIAYSLLPIFNEPWYRYGLFSIRYIPIHLREIFTALPLPTPDFPFIKPSLNILALWFITPAFFLIAFANFKKRLIITSLLTVLVMSIPGLTHGENGFAQFGYRFALDFMPFLIILTCLGMRDKVRWWARILIFLSILINLWGVIMISFLDKRGW